MTFTSKSIQLPSIFHGTYNLATTQLVAQAYELKNYYNNPKLFEQMLENFFMVLQTRLDLVSLWIDDADQDELLLPQEVLPEAPIAVILNEFCFIVDPSEDTQLYVNLIDQRIKKFLEKYLNASTYQNNLCNYYNQNISLCEFLLKSKTYQSLEYLLRNKDINLNHLNFYSKLIDYHKTNQSRTNLSQSELDFLEFLDHNFPQDSRTLIIKMNKSEYYELREKYSKLLEEKQKLEEENQKIREENHKLKIEHRQLSDHIDFLSIQ